MDVCFNHMLPECQHISKSELVSNGSVVENVTWALPDWVPGRGNESCVCFQGIWALMCDGEIAGPRCILKILWLSPFVICAGKTHEATQLLFCLLHPTHSPIAEFSVSQLRDGCVTECWKLCSLFSRFGEC